MHISKVQDVNVQTERTEDYKAPTEETAWSRMKKALGPVAVVGVVIAKFFANLKFVLLPLLKFLPILLKSGGTMLLMIWVYTQIWGWQFALGFVLLLLVHESGAQCVDGSVRGYRRAVARKRGRIGLQRVGRIPSRSDFHRAGMVRLFS